MPCRRPPPRSVPALVRSRSQAGVTLVELMITVVVLAILATVAVRSLSGTRQKATRQDASACLTGAANRQEAFYQRFNRYASTLAELNLPAACGNDGAYTLSPLSCGSAGDPCYGFQATPDTAKQAGRAQVADGTLKLEIHYREKRPDLRAVKSRQPASGPALNNWLYNYNT